MNKITSNIGHRVGKDLFDGLKNASKKDNSQKIASQGTQTSFMDHLTQNITDVNHDQKISEEMATDLVSGKKENIHETMLATTKADLSFKMMVQVRNKVLEAYNEIMRMPV